MTRSLIASATMGALLALASPLPAQAQVSGVAVEADQAAADEADTVDEATLPNRHCLQHTGSRITEARNARAARGDRGCVLAAGRVYSRADIDSTGAVDLADALRRLDPSIR